MSRAIELLIGAALWYLAMAWIQWEWNPQGWHWITRSVFVFALIFMAIVQNRPAGGK